MPPRVRPRVRCRPIDWSLSRFVSGAVRRGVVAGSSESSLPRVVQCPSSGAFGGAAVPRWKRETHCPVRIRFRSLSFYGWSAWLLRPYVVDAARRPPSFLSPPARATARLWFQLLSRRLLVPKLVVGVAAWSAGRRWSARREGH